MANETLALDLDLFDNTKNGYVPEQPEKKRIPQPKLLEEKPVSRQAAAIDSRVSRRLAVKACAVALVMLIAIGSLLLCKVVLTEKQLQLRAEQEELAAAQSEFTSLQMQYNSKLALDKVELYAKDKLGMVKRENYQIRYFDLSGSDGIRLTQ